MFKRNKHRRIITTIEDTDNSSSVRKGKEQALKQVYNHSIINSISKVIKHKDGLRFFWDVNIRATRP